MFDIRERRAVRGSKNQGGGGGSSKVMGIMCPHRIDKLTYVIKYGDVKLGPDRPEKRA